MFCEKNKLQALTRFCSTDNTRMALKNIRFENGETAIASDGYVLAIAAFKQDEDLGIDPPVQVGKESFSVSVDSVKKSIKNLSKKSPFRHLSGVFVGPNEAVSFSDVKNFATYKDDVPQDYPDVKRVLPAKIKEDMVVSFGREPLATLCETMKLCNYNAVSFRIKPMCSKGFVNGAVHFSMHGDNDDEGITGVIMPYTTPDCDCNTDHIQIEQEDVSSMIDMLCELIPENERVVYLAEKYKKLASTTESLAA